MPDPELFLIPRPKEIALRPGFLDPRNLGTVRCEPVDDWRLLLATCLLSDETGSAEGGIPIDVSHGKAAGPPEGYALRISPKGVSISGTDALGALWGIATLRQLVRVEDPLPALEIRDWPSLPNRFFLDDVSRGPIPTTATMRRAIEEMAGLKMNGVTYYIEHVFDWKKHPDIPPRGGAITAEEIGEVVRFAEDRGVRVAGGLQSFGHMRRILELTRYRSLAESDALATISPANPETYALLGDLYEELVPLLPDPWFLVGCDETDDLGRGLSGERVKREGIAAVYADHIERVRALLAAHGKRILVFADVALRHPEVLDRLHRDVVLLPWTYDARDSYRDLLEPLAKAGFSFFVCPGTSCWGRFFPDVENARTNIRNFVRDGEAAGALGAIVTTWDDDGENLWGCNLRPLAWGAACAWEGSAVDGEAFDRAFSRVLFGTKDESASEVVAALAGLQRVPALGGFRHAELTLERALASLGGDHEEAFALVAKGRDALARVRASARRNRDLLDFFDYALARSEFHLLELGLPCALRSPAHERRRFLDDLRRRWTSLRETYERLWLSDSRPYFLDEVLARFDARTRALERFEGP